MRQRGAADVELRPDGAVELRLVVLPAEGVERGALPGIERVMPQGVVDHHIQPARILHDAVDHGAHRLRRADVGLHGPGVATGGLALRHHGLGSQLVAFALGHLRGGAGGAVDGLLMLRAGLFALRVQRVDLHAGERLAGRDEIAFNGQHVLHATGQLGGHPSPGPVSASRRQPA
ncbi:hypothetical protein G6F50_015149 [Rhizopus delemar]|uniref:Uncharacterized protein n=1 Tax=Rhizopus delemar TaxID=936053 RepID=A0A9P7C5J4_9FUNG|nr:hypothetical protein G6F50_015149 [Rhizopus delemar]